MENKDKIRVMIIDDSALMRNLITKTLNTNNKIEVVGTAINGKFGLKKLNKLKPDIIILDLEMPEMNGLDFLKEREKLGIKTPIIILSAHAKKGAKITLDALALGASDFILKPSGSDANLEKTRNDLINMVTALALPNSFTPLDLKIETNDLLAHEIKIIKAPKIEIDKYLQKTNKIDEIKMISIGISTGGPNALRKILPTLPADFPVPITIVQHMPAGFTFEFAKNLNSICKLEVKEISDNDIVKPGRIYIAPGNRHIYFENKKLATVIRLKDSPPVNGHIPSAAVLFESTAEVYGKNSIGCIMTGMGKDGSEKIGLILKKGGITIAQDQDSSIVFGMPKMAIINKNIQLVRPLDQIITTLIKLVTTKSV